MDSMSRSDRRYAKGSTRRAVNRNAGTGASLHVDGRTALLSTVGQDAGYSGDDPTTVLRKQIRDALDPSKAPSKPKTFAQMSEAEREEMRMFYERGGR